MKIERLIGIVMILLQRDKVTAPELAERFEVSRRTISRDIEQICKAGIPLITAQGCGGGISIAEGYRVSKTLFTEPELQAILTGLKGMDSVSQTSCFTSLVEKLSSKTNHVVFDDVIIMDLASYAKGPLTQKIEALKRAIKNRHYVSFCYYYGKGESQRKIEPYRLLFKWSSWYVWGYCLERKDFRLFKLNRLWNLNVSSDGFPPRELPAQKMDFERFFKQGTIHLKALFAEGEKYRLIEEYSLASYTAETDGRLLFEWDFASYQNLREWILSFGDQVEVLEPASLRKDLYEQAQNLLRRYQEHAI